MRIKLIFEIPRSVIGNFYVNSYFEERDWKGRDSLHSSISDKCVKIDILAILQNLFTLTSESEEANYFTLDKLNINCLCIRAFQNSEVQKYMEYDMQPLIRKNLSNIQSLVAANSFIITQARIMRLQNSSITQQTRWNNWNEIWRWNNRNSCRCQFGEPEGFARHSRSKKECKKRLCITNASTSRRVQ